MSKFRKGNEVKFTRGFYADPYSFVPVFEFFEKLDKMGISSGGSEFSVAIRDTVGTIESVIPNSEIDIVFLNTELFGDIYQITVGANDIKLTQESIEANKQADMLAKLARQEKAGQLNMFEWSE